MHSFEHMILLWTEWGTHTRTVDPCSPGLQNIEQEGKTAIEEKGFTLQSHAHTLGSKFIWINTMGLVSEQIRRGLHGKGSSRQKLFSAQFLSCHDCRIKHIQNEAFSGETFLHTFPQLFSSKWALCSGSALAFWGVAGIHGCCGNSLPPPFCYFFVQVLYCYCKSVGKYEREIKYAKHVIMKQRVLFF